MSSDRLTYRQWGSGAKCEPATSLCPGKIGVGRYITHARGTERLWHAREVKKRRAPAAKSSSGVARLSSIANFRRAGTSSDIFEAARKRISRRGGQPRVSRRDQLEPR